MKYLIEDSEDIYTSDAVSYLEEELKMTDLSKENIKVCKSLKRKVGLAEIIRILDENGLDVDNCYVSLHTERTLQFRTGHNISFSKAEVEYRFSNVLDDLIRKIQQG